VRVLGAIASFKWEYIFQLRLWQSEFGFWRENPSQ
jgi:hypothetical protein